jgi:hypothetical protein
VTRYCRTKCQLILGKAKNINSWMQTQMFYIFYRLFKFISFLYQYDFLDLHKKRLHFNFQSGEHKRSKMKLEIRREKQREWEKWMLYKRERESVRERERERDIWYGNLLLAIFHSKLRPSPAARLYHRAIYLSGFLS